MENNTVILALADDGETGVCRCVGVFSSPEEAARAINETRVRAGQHKLELTTWTSWRESGRSYPALSTVYGDNSVEMEYLLISIAFNAFNPDTFFLPL